MRAGRIVGAGVLAVVLTMPMSAFAQQCGSASWYAMAGNTTASGEVMNPDAMTAAHPDLPFGTVVRVTNQANGKSIRVRINDRGPYTGARIIDLSMAAANDLGFRQAGHTKVCLTVL